MPSTVKKLVYEEYGVDPRRHVPGEIDHFVPLCAGGSNDVTNLWFQPATNTWDGRNYGHHQKDDLEAWVCHEIRMGVLDPKEAFCEPLGAFAVITRLSIRWNRRSLAE